jgi:hypothetical protein
MGFLWELLGVLGVIPGRAEGANPESITPVYPYNNHRGYGFRIAASRRPE